MPGIQIRTLIVIRMSYPISLVAFGKLRKAEWICNVEEFTH